jgi:hypothetical protein
MYAAGDAVSSTFVGRLNGCCGRDPSLSIGLVALTFLVAGGLWSTGLRFLKRDTELAPTRLSGAAP